MIGSIANYAALGVAALAAINGPRPALAVDNKIVFIVCDRTADGEREYGSGVIVSPDGKVLTAKHVVDSAVQGIGTCRGSIGYRSVNNAKDLIVEQVHPTSSLDVVLMRFVDTTQTYDYASYCNFERWMKWRPILVAGFPGVTESGAISARQGILSTGDSTGGGLLEIDSLIAKGMSGGPVFSKNREGFIGIVIGAKAQRTGGIAYEAILPTSRFATWFNLTKSERACYHRTREVWFEDGGATWSAGDEDVPLGIGPEEATCGLGVIKGVFNHAEDRIAVEVREGEYWLTGHSLGGGELEATARCYWIE